MLLKCHISVAALVFTFVGFLNSATAKPMGSHHILIDPGHGGRDVGAQVGSYKESEVVWKWALVLKKSLIEKGFKVSLSRDETTGLPLAGRIAKSKDPSYDFILSLHANYLQDPRVKGVEYFTLNPLNLEDQQLQLAHEETRLTEKLKNQSENSSLDAFDKQAQVSTILQDLNKQALMKKSLGIAKLLQQEWRGKLKQGPFDILTQARAPAVLVELGFLSNPMDQKNLVAPHFIQQQSTVMAGVIAKYFSQDSNAELNP